MLSSYVPYTIPTGTPVRFALQKDRQTWSRQPVNSGSKLQCARARREHALA